jgi:hypothetical protein
VKFARADELNAMIIVFITFRLETHDWKKENFGHKIDKLRIWMKIVVD